MYLIELLVEFSCVCDYLYILYTVLLQSCKHESWISISKHLMDDLPVLLSSENVKDIKDVLSTLLSNLPPNFAEFIKWVAEVRRQEENGQKLSEEEKGRLAIKVRHLKKFSKLKDKRRVQKWSFFCIFHLQI